MNKSEKRNKMGEIRYDKGYVVNEDGTIVRNRECPKCGKKLFSEGEYCEHCGIKLDSSKKQNSQRVMVITLLALFVSALIGVIIYQHYRCDSLDYMCNSLAERLKAVESDTRVESPSCSKVSKCGQGSNIEYGKNNIAEIIQQRDDLLIEVRELQEKTRKLQNKVNELEEENGYLTTDVRLATEALKECMGK